MNDVEIETHATSGLAMAWVLTAEGLRMRWTHAGVDQRTAPVEIDAVKQPRPALAA